MSGPLTLQLLPQQSLLLLHQSSELCLQVTHTPHQLLPACSQAGQLQAGRLCVFGGGVERGQVLPTSNASGQEVCVYDRVESACLP